MQVELAREICGSPTGAQFVLCYQYVRQTRIRFPTVKPVLCTNQSITWARPRGERDQARRRALRQPAAQRPGTRTLLLPFRLPACRDVESISRYHWSITVLFLTSPPRAVQPT